MRALRAFALAVVIGLVSVPAGASVSQYPVVITGDSILRLSEAQIIGPGRFADLEDGRQAYIAGTSGRLSSDEAARLLIPMVEVDGWFVFQDNGAQATQTQWRALLQSIVSRLPDDRCLLGVLPVFIAPGSAATIADTAAKANIMVQEFNVQPCHEYVRWNQQVNAHPELVYDGQHPTAAGQTWLADQISLRTGHPFIVNGPGCTP